MKKRLLGCILVIIIVLGGKYLYELRDASSDKTLYENKDLGIGFLIPEGYRENPFKIEENVLENGVVIDFLEPESEALIFSLYYVEKDYWDKEVKENFSVPYSEVYRDESYIILCVYVSDVQYEPNNAEQREKCLVLSELKDEVCESLYFIE